MKVRPLVGYVREPFARRQTRVFCTVTLMICLFSSHASAQETWSLAEEFRLGSVQGSDEEILTRFRSVAVGSDGRLAVPQPMDHNVRVYTPDGALSYTVGRRGEGPGEFQRPEFVGWLADTLWVVDTSSGRVSLFDSAGRHVDTYRQRTPVRSPYYPGPPVRLLTGRRAVAQVWASSSDLASGKLNSLPVLLLDSASNVLDTLLDPSTAHQTLEIYRGDGPRDGVMYTTQPFSDRTRWGVGPQGDFIVSVTQPQVAARSGAEFTVTGIKVGSDTLYTRVFEYDPISLDRKQVDSVVDFWAEHLFSGPAPPQAKRFASKADAARAVRKGLYVPEYYPPVTDVVVASDGFVWIRREDIQAEQASWDVLDTDGELVSAVTLPRDVRVLAIDGLHVWGQTWDEYGATYLVRFRILSDR